MSSSSLYLFSQYKKIEISSHWTEWKKKKKNKCSCNTNAKENTDLKSVSCSSG